MAKAKKEEQKEDDQTQEQQQETGELDHNDRLSSLEQRVSVLEKQMEQ